MNIRAILLGTAAMALLAGPAAASAKQSDYDQRLQTLDQTVAAQKAEIDQLKSDDAATAQVQQSQDATSAQVEALQNQMYEQSAAEKSAWWQNTKISGRMYFDVSNIDQKSNGANVNNVEGVGFDLKRFYIGVDHKFDDTFSANITTDFTYDSTTKATQLYIKKAYLDAHIDDAFDLKLGSTDLPWIPFVEDIYGYRYVENVLIDRTKFGTSADWGVHASGKFGDGGMFSYALSVINGAGYKAPPGAGNTVHFKSVDVEGRLSANIDDFVVGIGGYTGDLGKDVQGATVYHTADRFDALAAYKTDAITAGVEYFTSNNWSAVTSTTSDSGDGWSGFASYHFDPQWGVFGRYDWVAPNKDTASHLKDNYYNFGITYSPAKIVDLSLVYKHERATDGSISTSNGSIGGSTDGTYNEIGLFGQFRW